MKGYYHCLSVLEASVRHIILRAINSNPTEITISFRPCLVHFTSTHKSSVGSKVIVKQIHICTHFVTHAKLCVTISEQCTLVSLAVA